MHRMMSTTPPLFLSAADVRRALPMGAAIEAMREAFGQLSDGQVTLPIRQSLPGADKRGVCLVMSCYSNALRMSSLKSVTVFPDNPRTGRPALQALVILADGASGSHLAVMDGASLTAIRTGAASGLATDLLARPDASVAAIFGAGVQARTQLEAVCCVRALRRAMVYDPDRAAADRFAAEMSERLELPVEPADAPSTAVADAQVICTATHSSQPVLADEDVRPGTHINAVGAFRPETAEIPGPTVCRARVVVDHLDSALDEAGDLLQPLRAGLIDQAHFSTELGHLVLGRAPGRRNDEEITLFKSVGIAIQDLCAAAHVLERARQLGLGATLC